MIKPFSSEYIAAYYCIHSFIDLPINLFLCSHIYSKMVCFSPFPSIINATSYQEIRFVDCIVPLTYNRTFIKKNGEKKRLLFLFFSNPMGLVTNACTHNS